MTAQEYLKIKARLCNTYENDCFMCPLNKPSCVEIEINDPEKAEKIITTWDIQYPIITNAKKFKDVFGVNPQFLGEDTVRNNLHWWNDEYKKN